MERSTPWFYVVAAVLTILMVASDPDVSDAAGQPADVVVIDVPVLECECTEYSPVASSTEYSHVASRSCREGGQVDFNVAVRGLVPGFQYEFEITWTLEGEQLSQTWKWVKTAETDVYTLRESLVQRNDDLQFGMLAWDAYKKGTDPFRIDVTVRDMLPGLTTEEAQIGIRSIDSSVLPVRLKCGTPSIHLLQEGMTMTEECISGDQTAELSLSDAYIDKYEDTDREEYEDTYDDSDTEAWPSRFSFKELHVASLLAWSRGKAMMARPAPAVAILEPADGAVLLRECSGGVTSRHFQLEIRVAVNTGLLSAADLERAPAEAANYSVVLNGHAVVRRVLFRKCPASAEALTGWDGRHLCDKALNPQGTLSQHQTQYIITANVDFACPAEHMVVVNLSPLPPFPAEEVSAWAHFSLAARRAWHPIAPAGSGVTWPAPEPVPPTWFDGIIEATALRHMIFETYSDVCGSDGAFARGRRIVDTFAGFAYDYAVVHCLLQRHAPRSGVLLEIGTNDGNGLLALATGLNQTINQEMSEMSQGQEINQPRRSQRGWRLLTLDLPECLDTPDNASTTALDGASLAVCVRGTWKERRKNVGALARQERLVFTQLWGDSLSFDFAALGSVDIWWIDGAHDYAHCHRETAAAVQAGASLILYHDAAAFNDVEGGSVLRAAWDALQLFITGTVLAATTTDMPDTADSSSSFSSENKMSSAPSSVNPSMYSLHIVYDTRIVYALRAPSGGRSKLLTEASDPT